LQGGRGFLKAWKHGVGLHGAGIFEVAWEHGGMGCGKSVVLGC